MIRRPTHNSLNIWMIVRKIKPVVVLLFFAGVMILADPYPVFATSHTGLVIKHGDGRIVTRCVTYEGSSISGIELLRSSGLTIDISDSYMGQRVYGIDGEGTKGDWDSGTYFWAYFHQTNGTWRYSQVGAGSYQVGAGSVEGWVWAKQSTGYLATLPSITFEQICEGAHGSPTTTPTAGSQESIPDSTNQSISDIITNSSQATVNADTTPDKQSTASVSSSDNPAGTKYSGGLQTVKKASKYPERDLPVSYLFLGAILGGLTSIAVYFGIKSRQG